MSALYRMNYSGSHGDGFAVLYIGRGLVLGLDTGEAVARGTYREEDGRLRGSMTLTLEKDNFSAAGGTTMKAGESTEVEIDWPADFADGSTHQETVMGHPLLITFRKIGDIP